MGFLWVTGFSFFHCVASPFHSFVTTLERPICIPFAGKDNVTITPQQRQNAHSTTTCTQLQVETRTGFRVYRSRTGTISSLTSTTPQDPDTTQQCESACSTRVQLPKS